MALLPSSPESVDAFLESPQVICTLTYKRLDVQSIITSVHNEATGATAIFIGTTRNSFQGKKVTRLEYQAYSKLAIKTMANIAENAIKSTNRTQHQPSTNIDRIPSLIRCAIHHRLGTVPVGEPSIVIAVSSPHRKEAFTVSEEVLEEMKRGAQIWKREYYEGEDEDDAEWKENT